MYVKNRTSLKRKTLYVIMLLAIFFSAFGTGNLPAARAQAGATETPTNIATGGYVLSDGQFVYGPNVGDFNLAVYLQDNAPHLLKYADDLYGRSEYFSVNPKVYLTLLEVHAHLISNPDTEEADNPFGLNDGDFLSQIDHISKVMVDAYYLHLYTYSSLPFSERDLPPFITRNGNIVNVTPDTNAGTYSIIAALAEIESDENISIIFDNNQPIGFYQTYKILFPDDDPTSETNHISIPSDISALAAPSDLLQLPYSRGESWKFNGVHDAAGGSTGSAFANASSIDFSPGWPAWNADTSNMWVAAAASGTPTKISNCNFKVIHADGWETVYYHLENIQNFSGWINQNEKIGVIANTSAEALCNGGSSTGPHVHFTLKRNGAYVALDGTPLSGWYIHSGRWNYDTDRNYMWLERSGVKKYVSDWLLNESSSGTNCSLTADQIALYTDPNYGGSCVVKSVGNYPDPGSMGIANDSVSSIKVGSNVKLTLYGDNNYVSTFETFTNDDSNLSGNTIGDNSASSAKVEPRSSGGCSPNADQVALFVDANYGGACVVRGIGDYPNPGSLGIANDSVSSIKVGGNVKLTLCHDDNYSGICDSFTGDDSNLSDNGIGDNQVSSAKVESRPTGGSCTNGATPGAIQPGYSSCANEGGTCTFSGQASVAYGANNCFFYQTFTSSVSCSNSTFGDPIDGTSKTCSFKILTPVPSANFDAWGLSGTAPFTTAMHIVNTSNITSCSWNYGDGQTGTSCASSHNHTYNTAGTFTVSLTVSGPGGSDSMTRTNYISVTASGDSYEPDNSSGTASWISSGSTQTHNIIPATDVDYVKFQLTSPSAITLEITGPTGYDTRMWLYNSTLSQVDYSDDEGVDNYSLIDRQCSVDALPAGVYYIKVDDYDNDNEIPSYNLSFNITQNCTPPSANFDAWPQSGNAPFISTMHIVDTSNITSCSWNYGDGQTGTSCAATHDHTYNNAGTYTLSLTVNGPGGSDSMTRTNYITVSAIPNAPSNFTITGTTNASTTLTWQDNSNNETGFNIYRWDYIGGVWEFYLYAQVGANVHSYTDTQLSCSTDYYYQVSAYNALYESDRAGWIKGTTAACPQSELSITNITISPALPFTNDDIFVNVEVSNLSNIDTPAHWVDFYIDDTPTGCNDWGNYYGWSSGVLANDVETWTVRIQANSLTAGAHQFRAYVDSGCEVAESNESNNISSATSFTLTVPSSAAPAHDDFDTARLVSPIPYGDTVDVSGATTASDDPYISDCDLIPGMTSVWYKYTPSSNVSLNLDTFGSDYDTYIAAWSGSRGNLTPVGCNDDSVGVQSLLQVNLTAGITYYFEVAQYSGAISASSLSTDTGSDPALELPPGAISDDSRPKHDSGILSATSEKPSKPGSDVGVLSGGTLNFHVSSLAPILIYPAQSQNIGDEYNPTFQWNRVATATYYRLYVSGPSGLIDQWYESANICNTTTCSVASPTMLGGGAHVWYVQTWSPAGYGPWSNNAQPTNFNTTIITKPPAAVLTAPIGNIGTNYNPTYTWNKVSSATWYHLYVSGPSGIILDQWYQAVNICDTTTCSVASPTLLGGAHVWYVQTYNSAGYGPWSNNTQPTNFSTTPIPLPGAAVLTAPLGNIATNYNPTYTWNKVAYAVYYHLYVSGPKGVVLDQWYLASSICNATTCSVASPTSLGGGAHAWYVQTWNSAGYGPWSNNTQPTNFNTTIPTIPVAATLTSPNGTIANHTPTYTWNKVNMATWYRLYVSGPGGVVKDQWYQAASICNATTCSVVSPSLPSGAHIWYVQAYNVAGYSPWASSTFTVNP